MNIDRETELRRLARLLHKTEPDLHYLERMDGAGLQTVRLGLQNALLEEFGGIFERLASAGRLAPDALNALLCRKVFGPTLTANMSYYTPASRAAGMCSHFSEDFMTEVARHQVPERAQQMLEELPVEFMRGVTRGLLRSGDYHIMGGFTDFMPEAKVVALMDEVEDPADYLRVSSYAQRKDRIAKLAAGFDDDMLKELIAVAFAHDDLILEVGLITSHMAPAAQERMARLTDAVSPAYREQSRVKAAEAGLLDALAPYFGA